MGASGAVLDERARQPIQETCERLGAAIASRGCVLITGATTGLPDMVSRAARQHGGLTVGVSPAICQTEHVEKYNYPTDAADIMIYTGFALKGRNVINVRSADIVIILGGGMGTLNELTIAYDEGKVIGVLENSGGIADHLREIVRFATKPGTARLIFDSEPERLVDECLAQWRRQKTRDA
jgi:uncharacterized protein (TIGR00725 family)